MTLTEQAKVEQAIDKEGMWYCFETWSCFHEIKDEKFHRLREDFLEAGHALEEYIKSCAHKCTKDTVEWDAQPVVSIDSDTIEWYGTCECGKRVYEIYSQEPELYAIGTHLEL